MQYFITFSFFLFSNLYQKVQKYFDEWIHFSSSVHYGQLHSNSWVLQQREAIGNERILWLIKCQMRVLLMALKELFQVHVVYYSTNPKVDTYACHCSELNCIPLRLDTCGCIAVCFPPHSHTSICAFPSPFVYFSHLDGVIVVCCFYFIM